MTMDQPVGAEAQQPRGLEHHLVLRRASILVSSASMSPQVARMANDFARDRVGAHDGRGVGAGVFLRAPREGRRPCD